MAFNHDISFDDVKVMATWNSDTELLIKRVINHYKAWAQFKFCLFVSPWEVFITHGASEASGVRNFWHLSAKILYTVEPKTATSPCVHFEVAASPTEKKTSLLHVSILSRFEIVEIICPYTREIILLASFACWTTDNFQAQSREHLLLGLFSTFCWQT